MNQTDLENDLFLAAIPKTHHNLMGWEDFAESASKFTKDRTDHPVNQIDKAANTFAEHLIPYHSWVIVASSAEYHPTIAVEVIEMVMTATTDADSNFIKHMGIFRNPKFNGANHRNMSLKMHWVFRKNTPELKA